MPLSGNRSVIRNQINIGNLTCVSLERVKTFKFNHFVTEASFCVSIQIFNHRMVFVNKSSIWFIQIWQELVYRTRLKTLFFSPTLFTSLKDTPKKILIHVFSNGNWTSFNLSSVTRKYHYLWMTKQCNGRWVNFSSSL